MHTATSIHMKRTAAALNKVAILHHLFANHSDTTQNIADKFCGGDVKKARRRLNDLKRFNCAFQADGEWDGSAYESRQRGRGRFASSIWQVNCEPGPATLEQVEVAYARVVMGWGEDFDAVVTDLGIGC